MKTTNAGLLKFLFGLATTIPMSTNTTEQSQKEFIEAFIAKSMACINRGVLFKDRFNNTEQTKSECIDIINSLSDSGCLDAIFQWEMAREGYNNGILAYFFESIKNQHKETALYWQDRVCECIEKAAEVEYQKSTINIPAASCRGI